MNKVNRDTENNFPRNARNVQNVQCQCSYHCSDINVTIISVRNVPKGVETNLTIKVNNAQLNVSKNEFPHTHESNLQLSVSLLESKVANCSGNGHTRKEMYLMQLCLVA